MDHSPLASFMAEALSMINERVKNSVTGNTEEFLDSIKRRESDINQPCVCNACVTCTAAGPKCKPVHLEKNNRQVEICDLSELTRKDIKLAVPFEKCMKTADGKCDGTTTYIEGREWQMADESRSHGPGLEPLNHLTAYMVCMKGPGIIYFTSAGQGLKSYYNRLDAQYTEAKANVPQDFESELREKGFPEGYIKYLMILHEEYPKWQFEPVFTNVDYQEFLQYQIDGGFKCAHINCSEYCTNRLFEAEKSGKYFYATEEAIRYFSHPYSMLQIDNNGYVNALQFLKGEQKLPKEYSEKVVKQILKNADENIISAILNSDSCINPVLMAGIYRGEGGPAGEEYGGKIVYNLFNIGANGGRDDSLAYALENQWYTPEDCIAGSREVFEKYLERGQGTLYALDWDYQSYNKEGKWLKQYATAVNDAKVKASVLTSAKDAEQGLDLNQELIFSIPVYDNVPSYVEGEYEAFPEPK